MVDEESYRTFKIGKYYIFNLYKCLAKPQLAQKTHLINPTP